MHDHLHILHTISELSLMKFVYILQNISNSEISSIPPNAGSSPTPLACSPLHTLMALVYRWGGRSNGVGELFFTPFDIRGRYESLGRGDFSFAAEDRISFFIIKSGQFFYPISRSRI